MRGRSRAGSKSRRRKLAAPTRPSGAEAARPRKSSAADQEPEIARLTRELGEARQEQKATADVLGVISSFPGDLEPVFQTMLQSATRLCEAKFGTLFRFDGRLFHLAAQFGTPPELAEHQRRRGPYQPPPGSLLDRVMRTQQLSHTGDFAADDVVPGASAKLGGARSLICVPMLKDDVLIGAISIYRQEVRAFTDKQIELVKNFASQAVIAIENARLLNELRESLEQQTATANVLGIISSFPGELEPVFQAMLENAVRICEAKYGGLFLRESDGVRSVAQQGPGPGHLELWQQQPFLDLRRAHPGLPLSRVAATKQVVHLADAAAESGYRDRDDRFVVLVESAGARTVLGVPMLKNDEFMGAIIIYRTEVRAFSDKHIETIKNFAAQAVIAIENARLLNELRQRTADLSESLEQQTATSEVLRVISSSQGELELVFRTILESATRLCEANFGTLFRFDGENLFPMAQFNLPAAYFDALTRRGPFKPIPGTQIDHAMRTRQTIHTADRAAEPLPGLAPKLGGARSQVTVPMLKEDAVIGAILIYRQEVRPFTDKQIALVQNFAAQAVIAIENARLLNELRESLEQQTATSDVLRTISSSLGELEPVFDAILEKATRICRADYGSLLLCEEDAFRAVAHHNMPPEIVEKRRREPLFRPGPASSLTRVAKSKEVVQIPDITADQDYLEWNPERKALVEFGGYRSILTVPMLKDNELIGAFNIFRREVGLFNDKQVALAQNFAAQAVIAIENARLLSELRESLDQQTASADVLRIISSSVGQLKPVFEAILGNAIRLCEANFGNLFVCEGNGFRSVAIHSPPSAYTDWYEGHPFFDPKDHPQAPLARLAESREIMHISDLRLDPSYAARVPVIVAFVDAGARTDLIMPMLKEDQLVGAIVIYRTEVRPFSEKQIELVQNFAAQAVIAIENARLLNELRESLDRQTATADILRVIASTPEDSKHALDTIAETASRMFGVANVNFRRIEGDVLRIVSSAGPTIETLRKALPDIPLEPTDPAVRCFLDNRQIPVEDRRAVLANERGAIAAALRELPVRSQVFTPLSRQGEAIGVMIVTRGEVQPFQRSDLDLMKGFADQAVIAIENARLLNELRESYRLVQQQAGKLEAQSQELVTLNQQLEQRVADQVGEIERMGRLRRFLPPQVADLIVASGTEKQLESHRREITALFCDLRGFTGFSESSDPEDVMALLREYHAAIGKIIIKYSGTLERYAGDGVMVIFNDPVPVENPALQAVLMALDMRSAIEALMEKWQRLGHEIGFGIGIAHGFATLGTIGFESRYDYAAVGTVSNVASRLCDEAKPGQILISPRVLLAVEKAVTVEPVGEFALKGIRRPMLAYNVLGSLPSKPN